MVEYQDVAVRAIDGPSLSPRVRYLAEPIGRFATVLFVALAVGTLPFFTIPSRVASLVSVAGLFALAGSWGNAWLRHLALGLLNWQLLSRHHKRARQNDNGGDDSRHGKSQIGGRSSWLEHRINVIRPADQSMSGRPVLSKHWHTNG